MTTTARSHLGDHARGDGAERSSRRRRTLVDTFAVAAIAGILFVAFDGGVPTRDPWHTLLWGTELATGRLPDYQVPFAPTPHPLLIVISAVLSPLGRVAEVVLLLMAMAALGAIAVAVHRLGERLYAWPVGLLAAVIVLTRDTFLYYAVRAGVDVMTLALILWAAVLEARRPRRGPAVLVLLLFAGLLRPEAWLFAAAYWLWLFPSRPWDARLVLAALAAAGPVAWALGDLVVTGDPLWSLHGTRALASELERPTGLAALPGRTWDGAVRVLGQPALLAVGAAGVAAGLVVFRRATALPVAVVALNLLAFVALALFGLPLNPRYLLPAGVMVILFVALAAVGWTAVPSRGRGRSAWIACGLVALVVLALSVPAQRSAIASLHRDVLDREEKGRDLRALLDEPSVRRALARCGPLTAPNVRLRPQFAYLTDRRERGVAVGRGRALPDRGVFVRSAPQPPPDARGAGPGPPKPYRELARSRSWIAYATCPPPSRRPGTVPRGASGGAP